MLSPSVEEATSKAPSGGGPSDRTAKDASRAKSREARDETPAKIVRPNSVMDLVPGVDEETTSNPLSDDSLSDQTPQDASKVEYYEARGGTPARIAQPNSVMDLAPRVDDETTLDAPSDDSPSDQTPEDANKLGYKEASDGTSTDRFPSGNEVTGEALGTELRTTMKSDNHLFYEEFQPRFEWKEESNAYFLLVFLPGFVQEDQVSITVGSGSIKVGGVQLVSHNNRYSRFSKDFDIPSDCEPSKLQKRFNDGNLTLILPKKKKDQELGTTPKPPPPPGGSNDQTTKKDQEETPSNPSPLISGTGDKKNKKNGTDDPKNGCSPCCVIL